MKIVQTISEKLGKSSPHAVNEDLIKDLKITGSQHSKLCKSLGLESCKDLDKYLQTYLDSLVERIQGDPGYWAGKIIKESVKELLEGKTNELSEWIDDIIDSSW